MTPHQDDQWAETRLAVQSGVVAWLAPYRQEYRAAHDRLCDLITDSLITAARQGSAEPTESGGGWIEWAGGENPVPGKRVEWRSRAFVGTGEADRLHWGRDHLMPIIAYRIVPDPTGKGGAG